MAELQLLQDTNEFVLRETLHHILLDERCHVIWTAMRLDVLHNRMAATRAEMVHERATIVALASGVRRLLAPDALSLTAKIVCDARHGQDHDLHYLLQVAELRSSSGLLGDLNTPRFCKRVKDFDKLLRIRQEAVMRGRCNQASTHASASAAC